jgi:hypothetical protein
VVMGAVVPVSARSERSPLVAVSGRRHRSAGGGDRRDLQGGALRERGGLGGCVAEGDAERRGLRDAGGEGDFVGAHRSAVHPVTISFLK